MKLIPIILVLFISCTPIQNNIRSWSKTDTAYQIGVVAITTADWAQTHWMAKNDWTWEGREYKEICPMYFNSKPHQDAIDILFPAGILFHTAIAFILPPKAKVFDYEINPRMIWQVLFIGMETCAVTDNAIHGAGIGF
jgi:hypothetical protein